MELLLAAAVASAAVGALRHNWTAVALLASFALSSALCWLEVPFNAAVWMVIDTAIIMWVIRPGMRQRDWLIVALFAPAWAIYFLQPAWAAKAVDGIVAAQMFLTFPIKRLGWPALRAWARFNRNYDPWRDGDLRAHA